MKKDNNSSNPAKDEHITNMKSDGWRVSSELEIEDALEQVWDKISLHESSNNVNNSFPNIYKYGIAASILLALGFGFLFYPINVESPDGRQNNIVLNDGTEVILSGGSKLTYNRLFGTFHRNIDLDGRAYFKVSKDDTPFIISTSHTTTEVVGTQFSLEDWNESELSAATITVEEGIVKFSSKTEKRDFTLKAGESSRLSAEFNVQSIPFSENALSWKEGNHYFNNMSIHDVFNMLEHEFGKAIEHPVTHEFTDRLTAFYRADRSLESIITDICTIKGYSFYETSSGFKINPE